MTRWSIKQNDTEKRIPPTVFGATKAKQTNRMILTQENQQRLKAKISETLTTAHHAIQSTRTPFVQVTSKMRVDERQRKLQNDTSHYTKQPASRSTGDPYYQTNTTASTTCRVTAHRVLGCQARIPRHLFLLLIAMLLHICLSNVIAYEPAVARAAGTARLQGFPTSSHHSRTMRATTKYSQLLSTDGKWVGGNDDDNSSFRPMNPAGISPEYIAQNVFTKTGQYRVFQPPTSDLRETIEQKAKSLTYNEANDKISMAHSNTVISTANSQTANEMKKTLTAQPTATRSEFNATQIQKSGQQEVVEAALAEKSDKIEAKQISGRVENIAKIPSPPKSKEAISMHTHKKSKTLPNTVRFDQPIAQKRKLQSSSKFNATSQPSFADVSQNAVSIDMKELEALLVEYAESFFNKAQYQPSSELVDALQRNHTTTVDGLPLAVGPHKNRPTRHANANPHHHHHQHHLGFRYPLAGITRKADGDVSVNIPRAMESGRLLFFSGLKKVLWPVFMGLQVLKSLLFALFLPTLIGSFGKLLGKGIVSGSAPLFIRPPDAPQDLDFRDNSINFDDDKFAMVDEGNKEDGYAYNQAEASQTHYTYNMADINRIEQQNKMPDSYLSALQTIGSASFKNSGSLSGSSSGGGLGGGLGAPLRTKPIAPANTNTFQTFQKVPASSLLLSNYDPFYSPLLSRLDSVFAQLKLNSDNENCREKLICLMYANPAKYAPYSNLVSAQLSRELNELRKPTSDNPDILRFFKYMRAAKDGQDGVECEKSFDRCKEFKDFENPAMVSTYHDINKLVQARKMT